jgi:hypothetical protein
MHSPATAACTLFLVFVFGFFADPIADYIGDRAWAFSVLAVVAYGAATC